MEAEKNEKARRDQGRPARKNTVKAAGAPRMPVAFRLPEPMIAQLDAMAARRGLDRSALLFDLVERALVGATVGEIAALAIEKIEAAGASTDAIMAMLEDVAERLAGVENTLKNNPITGKK